MSPDLYNMFLTFQHQTQHWVSFSKLVPNRRTILVGKYRHIAMFSSPDIASFTVVVCSNCQCSSAFCWSDLLFILFRIAVWPSAGTELSPWLFTSVVFIFIVVLVIRLPFPLGVCGRVWHSIVSVHDHCVFIYLTIIPNFG